jgi:hypothetical protein
VQELRIEDQPHQDGGGDAQRDTAQDWR